MNEPSQKGIEYPEEWAKADEGDKLINEQLSDAEAEALAVSRKAMPAAMKSLARLTTPEEREEARVRARESDANEGWLAVMVLTCPACKVGPGCPCKDSHDVNDPHSKRVDLLRSLRDYINGDDY